ncbi:ankyrin repeat domain-containing protein [Paraburkholderia sacchari]|uniref:ankyrin repeat domain-containing protein n=1 Tax=Paraburkholderia sacchari TaxID=159450 RepID=UPI001BCAF94D|nr:ankyrin repeat domain-containing protein [Paraburkholderia sacchari]
MASLRPVAAASPELRATIYVYQGQSVNFRVPSWSAFIGVDGPASLLNPIHQEFQNIPGVKVRLSDYIRPSQGLPEFHIEDGKMWRPVDAETWHAADAEMKNVLEDEWGEEPEREQAESDVEGLIQCDFAEEPPSITSAKRMFAAARRGDILELQGLCASEGVSPSDVFKDGESLLFPAANRQRIEMCEWLIENHVRVDHQDRTGRTALLSAIVFRDASWKQKIITVLSRAVSIADHAGVTPLMRAATGAGAFGAKRGNFQIVKALVEHGADVFAQDQRRRTALGHAMAAAKASEKDVNQEIISFLEGAMVEAAAMSEFRRFYSHHFSPTGVLMLQHRSP